MRKIMMLSVCTFLLLLSSTLLAAVEGPASCAYCNMDRDKFAHSRMLIEYEDGTATGVCSLHCAAVELSTKLDKIPAAIKVGDYNTRKLLDAEKAIWVIGGSQNGVMTGRGKWAFEKKEDAERFVAANGGKLATFDEAMNSAYEDMYKDTKMIRERRKVKRMQQEQIQKHEQLEKVMDHGKM